MNGKFTDHDLLQRLDEAINGKDSGIKDSIRRLEEKLDKHFDNHKRERSAIIVSLAAAITSLFGLIYRFIVYP